MDLSTALTYAWPFDAHTTQHVATDPPMRIKVEAFDRPEALSVIGGGLRMWGAIFDVDDPLTHGKGEPARQYWRDEFNVAMRKLTQLHPGLVYWHTRGGARIVGRLPEVEFLTTQQHLQIWRRRYLCWLMYLEAVFGIRADRACASASWLFRLPRATRRGNDTPDDYGPVYGDPSNVGTWSVDTAIYQHRLPASERKAYAGAPGEAEPYLQFGEWQLERAGLLGVLLWQRRAIDRELTRGKFAVECPSGLGHGRKSDTVLWSATDRVPSGVIHCSHARCQAWARSLESTLALFHADEIRSAITLMTGVSLK